jgi:hypothetical protein
LDSTRLHVLQQNQPGPPFFYDYYNSGSVSTTQFMFLVFGAFAPNLNTPQTYINPPIVEFPLDENGDYIDTIVMKAKNQSIDHLIHQLYPEDSVGIFFGCGSGDASIYPCHIAFMDSLEMLGLPYEFYDHTGGHIMPAGFKQRGLIFIDSLLSPPGTPPISCLPNGIAFGTQEQIDNFQINHPNCTEIEGDVTIFGNNITNLNGLSALTSIGGSLYIGELPSYGNPSLTSLAGLEGLASIGGNLWIFGNDSMTSLTGLGNLTSVAGDLRIGLWTTETCFGNPLLSSLEGLDNLISIGGLMHIVCNESLTSLSGLENIISIGGSLNIGNYDGGNPNLTSLSGLVGLSSIGGGLYISDNEALTSLTGLENIEADSISQLTITNNNLLSECHVLSVCNYLANPNGPIEIHDNTEGCNDTAQVHAACLGVSIEEIMDEHDFVISPNPNNGFATLSYNTGQVGTATIEIYNTMGKCIQSRQLKFNNAGQQHFVLDFTGFPSGMYLCKFQIGDRVVVKKIIKQ